MSQSPEGSLADFHKQKRQQMTDVAWRSQSPEGSLADFHYDTMLGQEPVYLGRNPPKGPSPISTYGVFAEDLETYNVAIPRRVPRRFPLIGF